MAPALKKEFPEIKYAARIKYGSGAIRYNGKEFSKMIRATDADFLSMFSFNMLSGSASTALSGLSNIVISKSMAEAIFGKENPMDKTLQMKTEYQWKDFVVTGVIADFPENSSIEYDGLIRMENVSDYAETKDVWTHSNHDVYIQLAGNINPVQFQKKLQPFLDKNIPPNLAILKRDNIHPDKDGHYLSLLLTPLTDVHFFSDTTGGANKTYAYTLFLLAFFIMLIASINFINLSIARSFTRAKEVGVRKSIGANKRQLFIQIWIESLLVCAVAFVIGLLIAYFLLPSFRLLFKTQLPFAFITQPLTILAMVGSFLLVSVISGGYPALVMSGFNTIEILKGKLTLKKRGGFRNGFIVVQFSIAILLICSTIIVLQQLNYLHSMPLGFNKSQVISVPISRGASGDVLIQKMRNEFAMDPGVVAISGTNVNIWRTAG